MSKRKRGNGKVGKYIIPGTSWIRMLTVCAHSVGLRGDAGRAAIASAIRAETGMAEGNDRELIRARALSLFEAGEARRPSRPQKETKIRTSRPRLKERSAFPLGKPHPDYVKDDSFYKSRAWRELRYLALKNCAGCMACGAKASDGVRIHVDHIIPRYKAPHLSLSLDNLQVLCEDCNMGKGAWDCTDWRNKSR